MTKLPARLPRGDPHPGREGDQGRHHDFDKAVALQDWFRTGGGFTYSLDQRGGSGMDLLAHFVTDDRVGYCEQFASAMAAMARTLGIPSRVVVGFLDGQPLPDGRILYTSDERHAWPEMYFPGVGWIRFEPTPAQRAATPAVHPEQSCHADPDPGPDGRAHEGPRRQARRRCPRTPPRRPARRSRALARSWPPCCSWRCCCSGRAPCAGPSGGAGCARRTRCTSPRAPGPSCARPRGTSAWTGPSTAHRASRPGGSPPRSGRARRARGPRGPARRGRARPLRRAVHGRHDRARRPLPHRAHPGLLAARHGRQRAAPVAGAAVATVAVAAPLSRPQGEAGRR